MNIQIVHITQYAINIAEATKIITNVIYILFRHSIDEYQGNFPFLINSMCYLP